MATESSSALPILRRCSNNAVSKSKPSLHHQVVLPEFTTARGEIGAADDSVGAVLSSYAPNRDTKHEGSSDTANKGKELVSVESGARELKRRSKGTNLMNEKRNMGSSSSSSSSSLRSSSAFPVQLQHGGFHLRRRRKKRNGTVSIHGGGSIDDLQELALPLGMSFAAIIAQVIERKNISGERIPADHLSMICLSAVKEAVANVYGEKFECFLRNFEKSFGCTLKTLRVIDERHLVKQFPLSSSDTHGHCEVESSQEYSESHFQMESIEEVHDNQILNEASSQLILVHGHEHHQLIPISKSRAGFGFGQEVLRTFERSVTEQARSNDLKEVEIGLTLEHLQLKRSQLDLRFYANILEKVKISMGISKARFNEEKLKNQMLDLRHAEFIRRCIDYLVAGLLIMLVLLGYGAWVFSYKRITEATASCTPSQKESKSWWIPKQMGSFSSTWLMFRCHAVVLTRMSFGLLMILAIAYALLQRSTTAGPMMPVTFILLILGVVCGIAGKFCVDTLGGSGYWWLLHWEALCLLHFFSNAFPSVIYYHLYGPTYASQGGKGEVTLPPHWFRRVVFYSTLLLIFPTLAGMLPFASIEDWKDHLADLVFQQTED